MDIDITKISKLLDHSNINKTVKHYLRFKTGNLVQELSR